MFTVFIPPLVYCSRCFVSAADRQPEKLAFGLCVQLSGSSPPQLLSSSLVLCTAGGGLSGDGEDGPDDGDPIQPCV